MPLEACLLGKALSLALNNHPIRIALKPGSINVFAVQSALQLCYIY